MYDEIIAKYESGMSTRQLGNEYGVTHGFILKLLHSNGVELRSGKSDVWNHSDAIVSEYESEMTQAALARKYGCSKNTIHRILVKAGAL